MDRAKEMLRHMPLVRELAWKFARFTWKLPQRLEVDDLEQIGAIALLLSLETYDDSLGVPFGPYLYRKVKWAMQDACRDADVLTRGQRKDTQEGRAGHICHISLDPRASREKHEDGELNQQGYVALIPDPHSLDAVKEIDNRLTMQSIVDRSCLTVRERQCVEMFLSGETPAAIGAAMQVNQTRVSQLLTHSMAKFRMTTNQQPKQVVKPKAMAAGA